MKFNIYTLGCKVNTYESEALIDDLTKKGCILTTSDTEADFIIVNTCTVTQTSDAKSRKLLRQIARTNPHAIIVVMGCYSQLNPLDASNYANVVIGTNNRLKVYELVESYLKTKQEINIVTQYDKQTNYEEMKLTRLSKHTRGFIKIQDGCENFCAYCAIPYSRGPIRSRNADSIIDEINLLVQNGVKEVILSGINTGTYGQDNKQFNLAKLIEKICLETEIKRIRLSSIELMEITDELLDTIKKYQDRVAHHLHIPLQAGADNTLIRMKRKYLTNEFLEKTTKIKNLFPDIAITTDCLAGFVGETEEDFENSLKFIRTVEFAYVHVFPYSRRANTEADKMTGHLNPKIIHERARIMNELGKELNKKFNQDNLNKTDDVLFEQIKNGYYIGHTSNYIEVNVKSNENLINQIRKVKITNISDENLVEGELYEI